MLSPSNVTTGVTGAWVAAKWTVQGHPRPRERPAFQDTLPGEHPSGNPSGKGQTVPTEQLESVLEKRWLRRRKCEVVSNVLYLHAMEKQVLLLLGHNQDFSND